MDEVRAEPEAFPDREKGNDKGGKTAGQAGAGRFGRGGWLCWWTRNLTTQYFLLKRKEGATPLQFGAS